MPYDADKAGDVKKMKDKLERTYSAVDDKAARQAIHVWNSIMKGGAKEGQAWASVYAAMNRRGLSKKGASTVRVAYRFLRVRLGSL